VGGATCPNCGSLSFFDYCPSCHTPLTEQVDEMVAVLQQSEPHRRYFEAKQSYADAQVEIRALEAEVEEAEKAAATTETSAEDAAILEDLKGLNQRRRERRTPQSDPKAPQRPAGDPSPGQQQKSKPQQVRQNAKQANQDALAERKKRLAALKQRQKELEQVIDNPPPRPKEFSSNQELRRYFMAVKPPHPKGWICDAFNALHEDPMHCTKPGGGGRWVT
jgi:DNA repair exonuclease SbcCD ATPase subunit